MKWNMDYIVTVQIYLPPKGFQKPKPLKKRKH